MESLRSRGREAEGEVDEGDEDTELRSSERRKSLHQPDAFTVGYDETGETRVGGAEVVEGSRRERLIRHHEGRHQSDGGHSTREAVRDKKRVTQSFCSVLDLPRYQQERAVAVMLQLNLDRFGRQKQLENVALGVIRVVVDFERRRHFFGGREPSAVDLSGDALSEYPSRLGEAEEYHELCEAHGISDSGRYKLGKYVKRELERIGYFEQGGAVA
ncbi:DNA-directed RNA polymerase subunit epsilon [Halobacterium hubeiense]|uniref:DNA-directed RNA polymerase subunit epsilon n=1 Tax=Halobacterium hubeiense TaxID=1407499 RepID=UPI003C7783B5